MKFFKPSILFIVCCMLFLSCSREESYENKAEDLAQEFIIVDTHVDLPYRLQSNPEDVSVRTETGDFDYERAKEGGLNAPFMSIYIPARYQESGGAKNVADSLINLVEGLTTDHPDKFAIATSPQEIERQFKEGLISLPMGMENGAGLEGDLSNIQYFYDRGIRYITLAHSKDNKISDSSYDTSDTHGGLSDFGEKVVKEMNRVGIMVDISHVSDSAFYDVMKITKAPVIASHSSARYYTEGFERNMSDSMITKLAENGGTIMINFGSNFISDSSRASSDSVRAHISRWLNENDLDRSDPEAQEYIESYHAQNYRYATVSEVADHFDHVVNLVGIDHVGIGSDYDGVGDTLPVGLKDVSTYPNLIQELLDRGYTKDDIRKICYKNIFRVWTKVAETAETLSEKTTANKQ
ncbi:MAG: dipeptidase [Balneolaceae bacterium]|nr:dipeptidase [Balneolaceae bacterium]